MTARWYVIFDPKKLKWKVKYAKYSRRSCKLPYFDIGDGDQASRLARLMNTEGPLAHRP